jgi:penicillin-binding protein 1A
MLETVLQYGTAHAAAIGQFAAGKTGTTENYGDAWFIGWDSKYTVAVWVGYPNKLIPMTSDFNGGPVLGGTFPALIWHDFMTSATQIDKTRAEEAALKGEASEKGSEKGAAIPSLSEPPTPPASPGGGGQAPAPSGGSAPGGKPAGGGANPKATPPVESNEGHGGSGQAQTPGAPGPQPSSPPPSSSPSAPSPAGPPAAAPPQPAAPPPQPAAPPSGSGSPPEGTGGVSPGG